MIHAVNTTYQVTSIGQAVVTKPGTSHVHTPEQCTITFGGGLLSTSSPTLFKASDIYIYIYIYIYMYERCEEYNSSKSMIP